MPTNFRSLAERPPVSTSDPVSSLVDLASPAIRRRRHPAVAEGGVCFLRGIPSVSTHPQFDELHELFRRTLEIPAARRAAWLDVVCAEDPTLRARLLALLAADAANGDWSPLAPRPSRLGPGDIVAERFRLIRRLGEGGFGEVFEAEQSAPVHRQVAIKVLKSGADSDGVLRRFEVERQSLARLDHPGVATIFEAGVTAGGRPFVVMELAPGSPITRYCATHRLPLRDRVSLMASVCDAVQYAHSRGVIHRDLKPSNILVARRPGESAPSPRIIDFGVAKALDEGPDGGGDLTMRGVFLGTPAYASPEQAHGEPVDIRSDVYALGVILYELLTGLIPLAPEAPISANLAQWRRAIESIQPIRPSQRVRREASDLKGRNGSRSNAPAGTSPLAPAPPDLDWVTMRCLEKDPERRYATALELSRELRRFLANEPVAAGPPSARYRAMKFARRHRAAVAASGFAAGVLVAASVTSTVAAIKAERALVERNRALSDATARANELRDVAAFQASSMLGIDPAAMGETWRVALLEAIEDAGRRAALPSKIVAGHVRTVDELTQSADLAGVAVEVMRRHLLDPSSSAIDREFNGQPLVRGQLRHALGAVWLSLGESDRAEPLIVESYQTRLARLPALHPDILESKTLLGELRTVQGRLSEADALFHEALAGRRTALGDDHVDTLRSTLHIGVLRANQNEQHEARTRLAAAFNQIQKVLGPDHELTMQAMAALAAGHWAVDEFDEAERLARAALARDLWAPDDPDRIRMLDLLGKTLNAREKYEEGFGYLWEAYDLRRARYGAGHPETIASLITLGVAYWSVNELEDAQRLLSEAQERCERLGPLHAMTITTSANLGAVCSELGDRSRAQAALVAAYRASKAVHGPADPQTLTILGNIARLCISEGQIDPAIAIGELIERRIEQRRAEDDRIEAMEFDRLAGLWRVLHQFRPQRGLWERSEKVTSWMDGSPLDASHTDPARE